MRPHLLFWHLKSSCRDLKRSPPFLWKSLLTDLLPPQTSQPAWWHSLLFLRKGWMNSHFTPLPLFLHIPITEFPMEKTFLVFSQLGGHKGNILYLCQVLNSLQTGRVSFTGQHRQCSCCRGATGSAKRGKVLQRTALVSRDHLPCGEQQRQSNPVLCVTSHFWVLKGRKWDHQTNFAFAVHPGVNQSLNIALSNKQIDTNSLSDFSYHGTSLQNPIPLDLLQRGEYWGFQFFPLTLL